jgi:hypothetical protein
MVVRVVRHFVSVGGLADAEKLVGVCAWKNSARKDQQVV